MTNSTVCLRMPEFIRRVSSSLPSARCEGWRKPATVAVVVLAACAHQFAAARSSHAEESFETRPPASALPLKQGDLALYLDRLMMAESGGRDTARNPRSTAIGPFQFIESTFLELAGRHFAAETQNMTQAQILALRTDRAFATRAVTILTLENAAILATAGIEPNFANLRLAHLVGAGATVQLAKAQGTTPVLGILGSKVVHANPFMAGMTAHQLLAWSGRSLTRSGSRGGKIAGVLSPRPPAKPEIAVKCNLKLASCRKWLALAENAVQRKVSVASRKQNPAR
jgi:hypothetical protein